MLCRLVRVLPPDHAVRETETFLAWCEFAPDVRRERVRAHDSRHQRRLTARVPSEPGPWSQPARKRFPEYSGLWVGDRVRKSRDWSVVCAPVAAALNEL